jgi:hypothetical protein
MYAPDSLRLPFRLLPIATGCVTASDILSLH